MPAVLIHHCIALLPTLFCVILSFQHLSVIIKSSLRCISFSISISCWFHKFIWYVPHSKTVNFGSSTHQKKPNLPLFYTVRHGKAQPGLCSKCNSSVRGRICSVMWNANVEIGALTFLDPTVRLRQRVLSVRYILCSGSAVGKIMRK